MQFYDFVFDVNQIPYLVFPLIISKAWLFNRPTWTGVLEHYVRSRRANSQDIKTKWSSCKKHKRFTIDLLHSIRDCRRIKLCELELGHTHCNLLAPKIEKCLERTDKIDIHIM